MGADFLLAIDEGTSATKTLVFDTQGRIVSKAAAPLKSRFPKPGYVEQDPLAIYQSVLDSVKKCLQGFSGSISACGISNQRETFLLWDSDGKPFTNAVVWQCKRSIAVCERLKQEGFEEEINQRTGLIVDPYFSGTKLIWLYESNPAVQRAIEKGQAFFGTVDTWLLYKLTEGRCYSSDFTNACRTLLFNLDTLQWDERLLKEFGLTGLRLPETHPSSHYFGETDFQGLLPGPVPITAMIGDSHAAAFGEGCFSSGMAKATLGTGSSILMNTESRRIASTRGMVTTICWSAGDRVDFAIEGIIVSAGATIQWLRDQLGLFAHSRDTEALAEAVSDSNGVYLIPAFSGLGAPHWKMDAKAAILNLTFGSTKEHVVRAALESIPYQIKDVIAAMESDSGLELKELLVDGGITANRFVMQFLADLLNVEVVNVGIEEVSALGAAYLAGLEIKAFDSIDELAEIELQRRAFSPGCNRDGSVRRYEGWKENVQRVF